MKPNGFYKFCYCIARMLIGIFYRFDISGRENILPGAAMICINHSSNIDPFFAAFAFGIKHHVHFIAKISLFKIPVASFFLKKLGMISVERGISDVSTVKNTLGFLKKGEKVAIFPEGRRVTDEDSVSAKSGAVKLAERAGVPLIPVFIPRKKPLFCKITIKIGQPYEIEKQKLRRSPEDYELLSDELMASIKALGEI